MSLHPDIDPAIFTLRPDFTALSLLVEGGANRPSDAASAALLAGADLNHATWAEAHLEAWRDAYRSFAAKPKRTLCSADALRKRAAKADGLPAVNAVVDLYNAVSIRFAIPVGGEDARSYAGNPRLCLATGAEEFPTFAEGQPVIDHPETGEVIWRDDLGVTCRRWNWRQGPRTQITDGSRDMWFVLERLDPMPVAEVLAAGRMLLDGLRRLAPGLSAHAHLLDADNPGGAAVDLA